MTTLRSFLEMDCQHPGDTSLHEELFQGLKVMEDREFCEQHMGQYPVVALSLKDTDGINFRNACDLLGDIICRLASRFSWLKDSRTLHADEKKVFSRLLDDDLLCSGTAEAIKTLQSSLVTICSALFRHCGRKPVLLIDEYDVPLQKAAMTGYYEQMSCVVGTMLNRALRDRDDICKVILTGCLPATGEAIFAGVNGLCIDTVLALGNGLSAAIGFTPDEVRSMLGYYGFGELYEKASGWYDGYSIGGEVLFCPWDITGHVKELCRSSDPASVRPKSHWNLTTSSNFVAGFMPRLAPEDADRMQDLLAGRSISLPADEGRSYGTLDFNNLRSAEFWNILIYTGYLTLSRTGSGGANELRIPNKEILGYFRDNISGYYRNTWSKKYDTLVRSLMERLLSGDSVGSEDSMSALLGGFVPLEENAPRPPHENFYHGFLNGLLAAAGDYISDFQSQADAGSGYADITFSSYDGGSSVVIEVKYASDAKARLQDLASKAIAQIEEKGYAAGLCSEGSDRVVECGMAFRGRECAVRCKELLPDAD